MNQDPVAAWRRFKHALSRSSKAIDKALGPIAAPADAAFAGLSASGFIAIFGDEWVLEGGMLAGVLAFVWKTGALKSDVVVTPEERWLSSPVHHPGRGGHRVVLEAPGRRWQDVVKIVREVGAHDPEPAVARVEPVDAG